MFKKNFSYDKIILLFNFNSCSIPVNNDFDRLMKDEKMFSVVPLKYWAVVFDRRREVAAKNFLRVS